MTLNHDNAFLSLVTSSRTYSAAERVRAWLIAAAGRSRGVAHLQRLRELVRSGTARMWNGGLTVVVAAIVHLAITDYARGWMTAILPAIAVVVGVLAMVMAPQQTSRSPVE